MFAVPAVGPIPRLDDVRLWRTLLFDDCWTLPFLVVLQLLQDELTRIQLREILDTVASVKSLFVLKLRLSVSGCNLGLVVDLLVQV